MNNRRRFLAILLTFALLVPLCTAVLATRPQALNAAADEVTLPTEPTEPVDPTEPANPAGPPVPEGEGEGVSTPPGDPPPEPSEPPAPGTEPGTPPEPPEVPEPPAEKQPATITFICPETVSVGVPFEISAYAPEDAQGGITITVDGQIVEPTVFEASDLLLIADPGITTVTYTPEKEGTLTVVAAYTPAGEEDPYLAAEESVELTVEAAPEVDLELMMPMAMAAPLPTPVIDIGVTYVSRVNEKVQYKIDITLLDPTGTSTLLIDTTVSMYRNGVYSQVVTLTAGHGSINEYVDGTYDRMIGISFAGNATYGRASASVTIPVDKVKTSLILHKELATREVWAEISNDTDTRSLLGGFVTFDFRAQDGTSTTGINPTTVTVPIVASSRGSGGYEASYTLPANAYYVKASVVGDVLILPSWDIWIAATPHIELSIMDRQAGAGTIQIKLTGNSVGNSPAASILSITTPSPATNSNLQELSSSLYSFDFANVPNTATTFTVGYFDPNGNNIPISQAIGIPGTISPNPGPSGITSYYGYQSIKLVLTKPDNSNILTASISGAPNIPTGLWASLPSADAYSNASVYTTTPNVFIRWTFFAANGTQLDTRTSTSTTTGTVNGNVTLDLSPLATSPIPAGTAWVSAELVGGFTISNYTSSWVPTSTPPDFGYNTWGSPVSIHVYSYVTNPVIYKLANPSIEVRTTQFVDYMDFEIVAYGTPLPTNNVGFTVTLPSPISTYISQATFGINGASVSMSGFGSGMHGFYPDTPPSFASAWLIALTPGRHTVNVSYGRDPIQGYAGFSQNCDIYVDAVATALTLEKHPDLTKHTLIATVKIDDNTPAPKGNIGVPYPDFGTVNFYDDDGKLVASVKPDFNGVVTYQIPRNCYALTVQYIPFAGPYVNSNKCYWAREIMVEAFAEKTNNPEDPYEYALTARASAWREVINGQNVPTLPPEGGIVFYLNDAELISLSIPMYRESGTDTFFTTEPLYYSAPTGTNGIVARYDGTDYRPSRSAPVYIDGRYPVDAISMMGFGMAAPEAPVANGARNIFDRLRPAPSTVTRPRPAIPSTNRMLDPERIYIRDMEGKIASYYSLANLTLTSGNVFTLRSQQTLDIYSYTFSLQTLQKLYDTYGFGSFRIVTPLFDLTIPFDSALKNPGLYEYIAEKGLDPSKLSYTVSIENLLVGQNLGTLPSSLYRVAQSLSDAYGSELSFVSTGLLGSPAIMRLTASEKATANLYDENTGEEIPLTWTYENGKIVLTIEQNGIEAVNDA